MLPHGTNLTDVYREELFKPVQLLAFDFDGIFTDSRATTGEVQGDTVCRSKYDGMGRLLLSKAGIHMRVLSHERRPTTRVACQRIHFPDEHVIDGSVLVGFHSKGPCLRKIREELGLTKEQVLYMGDDLNDIAAFQEAGICVTVPDSPLLRYHTLKYEFGITLHYVTGQRGGYGAAREVMDLVIEAKRISWKSLINQFE